MLRPYYRFHQRSPSALQYSLKQHVPLQEHAALIFEALSDATQHSTVDEVSIEMEWDNNINDEELNLHMDMYEEDEELARHMDTYECCTPVLR